MTALILEAIALIESKSALKKNNSVIVNLGKKAFPKLCRGAPFCGARGDDVPQSSFADPSVDPL